MLILLEFEDILAVTICFVASASISVRAWANLSFKSGLDTHTTYFNVVGESGGCIKDNPAGVQFIGSPGVYADTLVVVTDDMFVTLYLLIHVVIHGSDVHAPHVTIASLRVSPNPTSGPVMIHLANAQRATMEVLNVIGKLVVRIDANAAWDTSNVPSGTYFIRASGVDDNSNPFVITQRVVIEYTYTYM